MSAAVPFICSIRNRPGKRAALPRPDAARLRRRQLHAHHAGDCCWASAACACCARWASRPSVFHMNEGHVAFLALELMREKMAAGAFLRRGPRPRHASQCIFTTHTPVEAGHDRFSPDLVKYALHRIQPQITRLARPSCMALGRVKPADEDESFCMTVLALKASRAANAVSELHGQVSREMWHSLYPGEVRGRGADRPHHQRHSSARLDERARCAASGSASWDRTGTGTSTRRSSGSGCWIPNFVSDEELWALRYVLRRALIEFARRRAAPAGTAPDAGRLHRLRPAAQSRCADDRIRPPVRHLQTRAADLPELRGDREAGARIPNGPIQFIFAGKAHPLDDEGKRYIQHIIHLSKHSELRGHLVFLENYDVHVARQMVSGCDVWLNNPRRPLEASGTSGQKIGCNGGLNLSILDGWWREGYDGTNGFAIGEDSHPELRRGTGPPATAKTSTGC